MPKLFLVHDLSPSRPWLNYALTANRKQFAEQNLEIAPLNLWACELAPSHNWLWRPLDKNTPPAPHIKEYFSNLAKILDTGKDLLFFSHSPRFAGHQTFLRILSETTNINPGDINALFIIGRPLLLFEQLYRGFPKAQEQIGEMFINDLENMPMLVRNARQSYGNVKITANSQEDPRTMPVPHIASEAFSFLERQGQIPKVIDSCNPLYFQSHTGRQLSISTQIRKNAWPPLDEGEYMETLLTADKNWSNDLESPVAMRQKLQNAISGSGGSFENELGIPWSSLESPDWLAEKPECDSGAPPDIGKIRSFAASLPERASKSLLQRYSNDERLLSDVQRHLYAALKETAPPEIRHLGEPSPPVEMTVLTMTYNQEEYISDCLESVLAQRVDFPVRHIVLDHYSTDGTAAIIKSYAEKHPSIRPVLLSRHVPAENVRGLFERCSSKYAALCDGDDFFTDPLKLQKQVDFLETHPRCSLCFHSVIVIFENGDPPFRFPPPGALPKRKSNEYYLADLIRSNFIQTDSAVYRWRFPNGLPDWFRADICPGDWYWHMLHAEIGKIGFLPETMAVYRRHANALYANAFNNQMDHWRKHAFSELHAYKVYNDHFKNRYFRNFSKLANGAFGAFFTMATEENNPGPLEAATRQFPEFAVEFYRHINSICKNAISKTTGPPHKKS